MQQINTTHKSITEHWVLTWFTSKMEVTSTELCFIIAQGKVKHSFVAPHMQLKIFSLRYLFFTFMLSFLQHTLPSQSIPADRYMHALQAGYWF